jgi:general secretion pathway protein M
MNLNLRERFERMEAREQKLLMGLVGVFAVLMIVLVPVALFATASARKRENAAIRDAMAAIRDARPMLDRQDAVRQKILARYARPAPALAGFLEQNASGHSIEIPESQDRPPIPHQNKRYEERTTKIELQKVGMKNLALFLEGVETSGYPVRISALNLRKRTGEPDSWDVSLSVSAFDRKEADKAKPSPSAEAPGNAP